MTMRPTPSFKPFYALNRVGKIAHPFMKKVLQEHAATPLAKIVTEWAHIVPPRYASLMTPLKTTTNRQTGLTTLHVMSTNKSAAFLLQYEQAALLMAIEEFFGAPLVHKIQLKLVMPKPLAAPIAVSPEETQIMQDALSALSTDPVEQRLKRLGEAMLGATS